MNTEKLITKGVEKHFDGQKVLFKVSSLKEHFEGLQIHESDIIPIGELGYVKIGDVNFDNATANEVEQKGDVEEAEELLVEETEGFPISVNPEIEEIEVVAEVVVPVTPKKKSKKIEIINK